MKVFLHSANPAYSGSGLLAHAINKHCCEILASFNKKDTEEFYKYIPQASFGNEKVLKQQFKKADKCIICSGKAIKKLVTNNIVTIGQLKDKDVTVILTDSVYCREYKQINEILNKIGAKVMAMYDIFPYCHKLKPIPYLPPTICETVPLRERKSNKTVICHSPFAKYSRNAKGSKQIDLIVDKLSKEYDIDYKLVIDCSRTETLEIKNNSDIFIDQLVLGNNKIPCLWGEIKYEGALGKSGCEGMILNTMVVSGCQPVITEPYFENPPAVFTNYVGFEKVIIKHLKNVDKRKEVIAKQIRWANKYLDLEFIANHVLSSESIT